MEPEIITKRMVGECSSSVTGIRYSRHRIGLGGKHLSRNRATNSLKGQRKLVVGSYYRPPDCGSDSIDDLESVLSFITENF